MRVTLSVGGKFQAFDLARELHARGVALRLITSYPKWLVRPYGIPTPNIRSLVVKELVDRLWKKAPLALQKRLNSQYASAELFDRLASRYLDHESDLFVGFSSFSLHTMRRAKKNGAITVIERASSHVRYQDRLLRDEYERLGVRVMPWQVPHKRILEKEMNEYAEADYISIPSTFVKNSFLAEGVSESKLIQIPYGVDVSLFRKVPKKDDVFRVIFGGGLVIRKGVHILLQACAELNLPNFELLLIGPVTEEMQPFLKRYQGLYRQIPYQPLSTLHSFYSQGSVFAFPSLEEGHGLVISQAMACGLPVITTDHTIGHDLIREGLDGFVIPIRDVETLKEKILYLYEHPDMREEMARSASDRIASGFSWKDYGDRITGAYADVLARDRSLSSHP